MLKSILKNFITNLIHTQILFKPYTLSQIASLKNTSYLNPVKREIPLIISLSASREDFKNLPFTIYSLLQQDLKADKITLWLDNEYEDLTNLPYEISQFIKNGLEIKFVDNFNNFTNTIEPLKNFNDSINVIAKENIFYPKDWLKLLYLSYISHPDDIHTHQTNKIESLGNKIAIDDFTKEEAASFKTIFNIQSGILYPPNCFTKEVLRKDIYLKYCPEHPMLWYWAMALVHNKKIRLVKNHIKRFSISDSIEKFMFKNPKDLSLENEAENLLNLYGNNIKRHLR